MKNSSTVNVLLAVLAASALASLILCGLYISKSRELRSLQSQQAMARYRSALYNQIANDVLEYGKKNPAINPLIDTYLRPKTASVSTNKPGSK